MLSKKFIKAIATFFGIGYIRKGPGTAASLAGLAIWLAVRGNFWVYCAVSAAILALGFWSSHEAEKIFGKIDDQRIVIDEVAGMLIALCNVGYYPESVIFIFIAFRGFDIIKPYPISAAQRLKGGAGIMLDDILAGAYTQIIYLFLIEIIKLSRSGVIKSMLPF